MMHALATPRASYTFIAVAMRIPQHKEKIMTIADRLRQEDIANGLRKGLQQGKQEG